MRISPPSPFAFSNRAGRILWSWVWVFLYRPSPRLADGWRALLLRAFGARIGHHVTLRPSSRIWAPWNLEMGDVSCLGDFVDCYSAERIRIGAGAMVSQYSFLCAASHDYEQTGMPGIQAPITIDDDSWVAADVYVGPGVTIGRGAIVGARSSVFKDVPPWTVVGGTPARFIKLRQWRP